MAVRIDQAGRDEAAAEVLDLVHIDDVIDHAGYPLRQVRGGANPGDPAFAGQDRGIAEYLGPGPQPADVGQQPNSHCEGHLKARLCPRTAPPRRSSLSTIWQRGALGNNLIKSRYCTGSTAHKPFADIRRYAKQACKQSCLVRFAT